MSKAIGMLGDVGLGKLQAGAISFFLLLSIF
jgi:hypothetical protein